MTKDQRKAQAIELLEKAKADAPKSTQAAQIKLAIARFFFHELGIEEKAIRNDARDAFLETPSFFGASANAMQELDSYVKKPDKLKEIMSEINA